MSETITEPTVVKREIVSHKVEGKSHSDLESIYALETPEGANLGYEIHIAQKEGDPLVFPLRFQRGPVKEVGANGVSIEALIAIGEDQLGRVNKPPLGCAETTYARTNLQKALRFLRKRTLDRVARGVEGASKP
jgi:hypothetical protein